MSILEERIKDKAKKKKVRTEEWLESCISKIPECKLATHIGKFTHPATKVFYWYSRQKTENLRYIMSDTVDYPLDITVNAAYISSAELLLSDLKDGKKVIEHILAEDIEVRTVIEKLGGDYSQLCNHVKQIMNDRPSNIKSDGRLRQVYFPVNNGYHLLTVMPASGILMELHRRISKLIEQKNNYRSEKITEDKEEKKNKDYGKSYLELVNMTVSGFGGTKSQNISGQNHLNHGEARLLESLPPNIKVRTIRLPKRDFWKESIPREQYADLIYRLQELFLLDRNNLKIRTAIRNAIDAIIDVVMCVRYQLLQEPAGWTGRDAYKSLPPRYKAWLDCKYKLEDDVERELTELSKDFSRWLIKSYERMVKDAVLLGDAEFQFFAERMKAVLKEEVTYTNGSVLTDAKLGNS